MTAPEPAPDTTGDYARRYAAVGLRVLPIPPGQKRPRLAAWQDAATTDPTVIDSWWRDLYADHGIGLAPDRLPDGRWWFVVDIDQHGDDGHGAWHELQAAYGEAPATVEATTGGGGTHLLYAAPHEIRNANRLPAGIDVRGHGGQIVVEPSVHPSGQRYTWVDGQAPWEHDIADAPGWLLAHLIDDATPQTPRPPTHDQGDRPGDIWAERTTWDELLTADGWQRVRDGHQGEQRWVRPGKDRRDGISATVGYKGSDVLKVFTSSVAGLRADETYTKLGYWAATRHGGDHSAAASALRALGHHRPDATLAQLAGERPVSGFEHRSEAPKTGNEDWPDPEPLPETPPPAAWPRDVLPDWMQAQVDNVTAQIGCDPLLPGTFGLGALVAAGLGHVRIRARAGHVVDATAYLIAAAPSAAGKSPALEMMMAPIRAHESRRIEQSRAERAKAEMARTILDKRAKKAAEAAAKPDAEPSAAVRAAELEAEAQMMTLPPQGRLIASDVTPEKLATLMADNAERIAIVSDEAGILQVDRYGDRKRGSNMDLYLQAHSGKPCIVDRQTAPSVRLEHPLLAIVAGVQPAPLAAALADPEFAHRGLGNRLMAATTHQLATNVDLDRDVWDHAVGDAYTERLGDLATRLSSWTVPAELDLSHDARRLHSDWATRLRARQEQGGDLEHEAGWVEKMKVSVIAVAGLLHLADGQPQSAPVDGAVMARAIALGDWWTAHRVGAEDEHADARRLLRTLAHVAAKDPTALVTRRDIGRSAPVDLRHVAAFAEPLAVLVEKGWAAYVTALPTGADPVGDARAMRGVRVHPKALETAPRPKRDSRDTRDTSIRDVTERSQNVDICRGVARVAYIGPNFQESPPVFDATGEDPEIDATRATSPDDDTQPIHAARHPAATPPDPDDDTDPGWLFTAPADNPGSETL